MIVRASTQARAGAARRGLFERIRVAVAPATMPGMGR